LIADRFSHSLTDLRRDSPGGQARCDAARFQHDDLPVVDQFEEGGRDTSCFAGTGRSFNYEVRRSTERINDVREDAIDGKVDHFY
jgi:hypothetical protein